MVPRATLPPCVQECLPSNTSSNLFNSSLTSAQKGLSDGLSLASRCSSTRSPSPTAALPPAPPRTGTLPARPCRRRRRRCCQMSSTVRPATPAAPATATGTATATTGNLLPLPSCVELFPLLSEERGGGAAAAEPAPPGGGGGGGAGERCGSWRSGGQSVEGSSTRGRLQEKSRLSHTA